MTDDHTADDHTDDDRPRRPTGYKHWTSFVADESRGDKPVRCLHEQQNPRHRLRVEHDDSTLFIHLSDEDGPGWTTMVVDRRTRQWAVSQAPRQKDTARDAFEQVYGE